MFTIEDLILTSVTLRNQISISAQGKRAFAEVVELHLISKRMTSIFNQQDVADRTMKRYIKDQFLKKYDNNVQE